MDHNILWFVSSNDENYLIYALDTSVATMYFNFSCPLPHPKLELPKSDFPHNMTFQVFGSKLFMLGGETPTRPHFNRGAVSSSNSSNPMIPSTKVYTIDLSGGSSIDTSMITEVSPLCIEQPLVLTCQDKLHVLSKSLNPTNSTPLIEILDSESGESWIPYHLPVSLLEELSSIAQSVRSDDDPYLITAYAAKGPQIVLRLTMFMHSDKRISSLTLDTMTNAWSFTHFDPCASQLPFPKHNLCLDSIWCATETCGAVRWVEWKHPEDAIYKTTFPARHYFDYTKVMEFGKGRLLALSCTTDPENLLEYGQCYGLVRVDFVSIAEYARRNLTLKKTCLVTKAATYIDKTSSGASRLQKVVYFYARAPDS